MERTSNFNMIAFGLIMSIGIVIAGCAVGGGISRIRASDRFVSVRGLAELEVNADLAIWPISFDEAGFMYLMMGNRRLALKPTHLS